MWILRLFNSGIRGTFVTKYLKLADNYNELKRTVRFKKFMRSYLRHDGTFVLKMIALNCGDIICSEIIQNLWTDYKSKCAEAQQPQSQGGLRRSSCMLRLSCNNLNEQPKTRRDVRRLRPKLFRRTSEPPPSLPECQSSLPSPKWQSFGKLPEIDEFKAIDEDGGEFEIDCEKNEQRHQDEKQSPKKRVTRSDSDFYEV